MWGQVGAVVAFCRLFTFGKFQLLWEFGILVLWCLAWLLFWLLLANAVLNPKSDAQIMKEAREDKENEI